MKKRIFSSVFVSLILVSMGSGMFFYQGCGSGMSSVSDMSSASALCKPSAAGAPIDKNYTVIPGEQTVSIAYGRPLLDSMVSCTGIGQPSTRTLTEWTARNQSLSEYGSLTEVSGAMMMAIAAVAGEVCRDLLDKEKPMASASRGIFGNVDFTKVGGMSTQEIASAADLLGVACWQRMPTLDEKSMVESAILQLNSTTDVGALSLCTSMLASLAAIAQ